MLPEPRLLIRWETTPNGFSPTLEFRDCPWFIGKVKPVHQVCLAAILAPYARPHKAAEK